MARKEERVDIGEDTVKKNKEIIMTRLLTPEDVCERYQIKLPTLYQWTSKNKIPHFKRGGLRFREDELSKWEEKEPELKLI